MTGNKKKLLAVKKKIKKQIDETVNNQQSEKTTDKGGLFDITDKNVAVLEAFIDWLALPTTGRELKSQTQFANKYKVNKDTLVLWKKRNGFYEEVMRRRRIYFREGAAEVIEALKERCIESGAGADVKVFLNYTGDLTDKSEMTVDEELKGVLKKIGDILPD